MILVVEVQRLIHAHIEVRDGQNEVEALTEIDPVRGHMPSVDNGFDKDWIRAHYAEYLRSDYWQDLRRRYEKSALGKRGCYVCGSHDFLHLHHKTYKRVGKERLTDLIYLCGVCHEETHKILGGEHGPRVTIWNVARRLKRMKILHPRLYKLYKEGKYIPGKALN